MEQLLGLIGSVLVGQGGAGVIVSLFVNILKTLGIVKDGTAITWVRSLNLLVFVVMAVLIIAGINVDSNLLETVITALTPVFGLLLQLITSNVTHSQVQGYPVIGKSYTAELLKTK